ncbi:MAG: MFS transporter [Candidatus Heimdallarchaeota archaeon]|nr:MFS transporter [Candidatus Heimdallarchaeota archaeon]
MSKENFASIMERLSKQEGTIRLFVIVGLFNFGMNFLITADYVQFRAIMEFAGITSSIKESVLLAGALVALGVGTTSGGMLSDSLKHKFTREQMLLLGAIVSCVFIFSLPLATNVVKEQQLRFSLIMLLLVLGHFFIGCAYAPWLAFFPELFNRNEKVAAAICVNFIGAFGAAIATVSFSRLIDKKIPWIIWLIIGGALLSTALLTAIFQPTRKKMDKEQLETRIEVERENNGEIFAKSSWLLLFLVGSLWAFSSHLVETGLIDSLTKRFSVSNTMAAVSSNILMGGFVVFLLIPAFILTTKLEKISGSILTSGIYALFCLLLTVMKTFNWIYFIVLLGAFGNILLSIFQFTLPAESVPQGKEGTYLGLFFAFTSMAKPVATVIQGVILEGKESNETIKQLGGYPWVFLLAAAIMLVTIIPLVLIKTKKKKKRVLGET